MRFCNFAMVQLGETVPVSIGGFVDAAVFAPAAEERVDSGGCDGLVLARTETNEVCCCEVSRQ